MSVVPRDARAAGQLSAIIVLCERAFCEPIAPYLERLPAPVHVLAHVGGALVSHACWVTRQLQAGDGPLLHTAYVELVATEPGMERRGYASAMMHRLAAAIGGYDLGALGTGIPVFYARLGTVARAAGRAPAAGAGGRATAHAWRTGDGAAPPALLNLDAPLSVEWRPGELW